MIRFFSKEDSFTKEEIKEGGAFLIDKDLDWTSFDVVNKLRFQLKNFVGVKKFKVGHAGTLDPRATGLLIVCFGKATKQITGLQNLGKEYTGSIYLGATTPTYDTESDVDQTFDTEHIDDDLVGRTIPQFIGEIEQVPPIFSALKKNGVAMYKRARAGEQIKMDPRKVTIHSFDVEPLELPLLKFKVSCSKGTYIRSLAYDFGKAMNSGGYLSSLRRTKIGSYDVSDSMKVTEVVDKIQSHIQ